MSCFGTKVSYHAGKVIEDFPSSVVIYFGNMQLQDGKWVKGERLGGLSLRPAPPPLTPGSPISINSIGRDELQRRGLPRGLAESVAAESPYRDRADLRSRMQARYSALDRPVNLNRIYWSLMLEFISANNLSFEG